MRITIESTSKIVQVNGIPCRIWEGQSENGVDIHCFITRVAVRLDKSPAKMDIFERELKEQKPPSAAVEAIPLRLIL